MRTRPLGKQMRPNYWKGDMVPPKGQAPSPLKANGVEQEPTRVCQVCGITINPPYATCADCYQQLDDTAKSRIRQQWDFKPSNLRKSVYKP